MERHEWSGDHVGDIAPLQEKEAVIEPGTRFFYSPKNWSTLLWVFFGTHCFCPKEKYAIAGDEVVTTKSGHKTYGVDWFFSSLAQRPVKGLALFALSLVVGEQRQSYPLRIEQVIRPVVKAKATPPESSTQTKDQRGRPKGSKNKDKTRGESLP